MDSESAARNLQVIRQLMERAAIYRRELRPVLCIAGGAGAAGAVAGPALGVTSASAFVGFWMVIAGFVLAATFRKVRAQALEDGEPFWSAPARQMVTALLPAFSSGFGLGALAAWAPGATVEWTWSLPGFWMLLYGCGLHAAGGFMPRRIRFMGWMFVGAGLVFLGAMPWAPWLRSPEGAFGAMGATFGLFHFLGAVAWRGAQDDATGGS